MVFVCRVCGVELCDENWHKQKIRCHSYICKTCTSNYNKAYHQQNKKSESDRCRQYYKDNVEKRHKEAKEWKQKYPDQYDNYMKSYLKSYFQTQKGKLHKRKMDFERRGLKYNALNGPFEGSQAHHIDIDTVIYIPIEPHKSIWHSLKKNINMEPINAASYFFLLQQSIQVGETT